MRPSEWIVETRLDGDRPFPEAVEWLQGYSTMADAWTQCHRGDWMIWALLAEGIDVPAAAIERIVARAIRRGQKSLRGVRAPWATAWRRWASRWLSGEDRTGAAAREAAADAARVASRAAWAEAAGAAADAARVASRAAWAAGARAAWASRAAAGAAADAARAAAWAAAAWAARAATDAAAAWAAAEAAELRLQARDLRRALPEWPGGGDR